jgi:hypothetical protein
MLAAHQTWILDCDRPSRAENGAHCGTSVLLRCLMIFFAAILATHEQPAQKVRRAPPLELGCCASSRLCPGMVRVALRSIEVGIFLETNRPRLYLFILQRAQNRHMLAAHHKTSIRSVLWTATCAGKRWHCGKCEVRCAAS